MGQEVSIASHRGQISESRESSRTLSPEPSSQDVVLPSIEQPTSVDLVVVNPPVKEQPAIQQVSPEFNLVELGNTLQSSNSSRKRFTRDDDVSVIEVTSKRSKVATIVDLVDESSNVDDVDGVPIPAPLPEIIDLEDFDEENLARVMFAPTKKHQNIKMRNEPIVLPWEPLLSCKFEKFTLAPRKVVEYLVDRETAAFLVIKEIFWNRITREVTLRGWKAIRTTQLKGMLETGRGTKNE